MSDQQQGFWSSIPGILTGLAAVITAVAGLFIAINGGDSETLKKVTKDEDTELSTPYVEVIKAEPIQAEPIKAEPITVVESIPDSTAVTLKALVDCKLFPTVNTVTSLMSWSDNYHKQVINDGASKHACNMALAYRAQAHCKNRNDLTIRQGLAETISLCNTIKFSWKDVQL